VPAAQETQGATCLCAWGISFLPSFAFGVLSCATNQLWGLLFTCTCCYSCACLNGKCGIQCVMPYAMTCADQGFPHYKQVFPCQSTSREYPAGCKAKHNSCGRVCVCVCVQNACYQLPGTCLANQLDDLTVADLARAAAGTTPLYLVGRYGGGISGSTQVELVLPARWLLTVI
jgi:hypothetical protein